MFVGSNVIDHIRRISTSRKGYGGNVYEEMVDRSFKEAKSIDYQLVDNAFSLKGASRLLEVPKYLIKNFLFARNLSFLKIRTMHTAFFNYKGRGVTIVHHIDSAHSPFLPRLFQDIIANWFLFITNKEQHIVVVAKFWKDYFVEKGFKKISIAYNGFYVSDYDQVTDLDVEQFKKQNKLSGKVIYIGNPLKKKGTDLVYEALADKGYTLVCSGEGDLELPKAIKLKLDFKSYICLLKASDVVITFSQFLEGWNRVAHEAQIVGTPVIGTGAGGMREVLEGGQQIICNDPQQLIEKIEWAISHREQLKHSGQQFARQFDFSNFSSTWQSIILDEKNR
jgi:glycosyltransferase involved in cell wall biosynthesis